ncbi:barstar family protein [Thioalkalicoccus limnaeus]|uniref:Barstar family protein n=1 Tax=Thioalkalicoccus limnaeus TaxID=120681 RepID=A0ABV4BE59_9GAMM
MTTTDELVEQILTAESAILTVPREWLVAAVGTALEGAGYRVVLVDRAPVFDKDTLLHALYQGCAFPAYFGFNWDALADMLTAKQTDDDRPMILVFQQFESLRRRAPEVAETFLEIVGEACGTAGGAVKRLILLNGE